ncbi:alkaline phosphatase family protein [Cystobacter fuscus]|uniref:alkaline phosphatase family protein n=1 Tax=Cystobacter fuscus TaxID=43 RepID=UPI0009E051A8|nr:alkaline phosphatase family protein [Cystobacter fuscus]
MGSGHAKRWAVGAGVVLLLVGVATGAWWLLRPGPPTRETLTEAVELATTGGDRLLREPMRPLTPGPRVLLFALDGVGANEFRQAVSEHSSGSIHALLGPERGEHLFEHGFAVPGALSILPSTTVAAWASVYTGQPPARTGVPGNEWFARDEVRFYAPAPVSVHAKEDVLHTFTDGLVGKALKVPTLFELADVRSFVSLAHVYRGADFFTTPEPSAAADLLVDFARGLVGAPDIERETYAELDQSSVAHLLEALGQYGVPRLQVVYFPGVDLYTHVASEPLEQQRRYVREVLDPLVGRVLDAYAEAGVLDDTYVLFVSDHGHTPVPGDDRHALSAQGEDEPTTVLERAGFRLRPLRLEVEPPARDFQAVVAYQGAMAYVYLADRSTCPEPGQRCDWNRPPRWEEDVLPVARAFHRANLTGEGAADMKGALDFVFARAGRPVSEDAPPFQVFDGERLIPLADHLTAHPRPDLLNLAERMEGLGAGPQGHRAGDVLLLTRTGLERPLSERFYFAGHYHSWHGSPSAQDSRVTFVVARRDEEGERVRSRTEPVVGPRPSLLHVTPLIRELLGAR